MTTTADWKIKHETPVAGGDTLSLSSDTQLRVTEEGVTELYVHNSTWWSLSLGVLGISKEDEIAYRDAPHWLALDLLVEKKMAFLQEKADRDLDIRTLRNYVEFSRLDRDPARMQRIYEGLVTWDELPLLFHDGVEVTFDIIQGQRAAGVVRSVRPCQSMGSPLHYHVGVEVYHHFAAMEAHKGSFEYIIPIYKGVRPLSSQRLRMLDAVRKAEFAERGKQIQGLVAKPTLCSYDRHLTVPNPWGGLRQEWAKGRVMIDPGGMAVHRSGTMRMFSEPLSNGGDSWENEDHGSIAFAAGLGGDDEDNKRSALSDDKLWMVWPFLPAYSFRLREWGAAVVEGIALPQYRADAYNKLVLDAEVKEVLRTLVEHHEGTFKDLVEDKSGGLVLLLPGGTGIGKTLTVEALADGVKRPLYSVSVGELGTNAQEIEQNFLRAMELAERWHAVMLLDEADLFLEARQAGQVQRNAIVSTFLRLLDKHNGVLFLTTNRQVELDQAIGSRISATIEYPELGEEARATVWRNLLTAAGVHEEVLADGAIATFAMSPINGRQIRSAIRIAQTLAKGAGQELTPEHVRRALKLVHG